MSAVTLAVAALPQRRPRRGLRGIWIALIIAGGLMVALNVQVLLASYVFQKVFAAAAPAEISGVDNLRAIDGKVWRGAHPTAEGYRELAAAGVTTVVDLRAEKDAVLDHVAAEAAGLQVLHLPVRDGQVPSDTQISGFLQIVRSAPGTVFLHCGAGVGRTGAMAAAYLVATGQATGIEALTRNLAVGPPSLEQIWWAGSRDVGDRPPVAVVALSRLLDAPRRIWASN